MDTDGWPQDQEVTEDSEKENGPGEREEGGGGVWWKSREAGFPQAGGCAGE